MRNVKSSRSASPITFVGSLIQKKNQKDNPAGPIQQSKQPSHKFDTRSLKVLAVNFFAMRCRPASGRDIADDVCNISASGHATYRGLHVVELGRKHPENSFGLCCERRIKAVRLPFERSTAKRRHLATDRSTLIWYQASILDGHSQLYFTRVRPRQDRACERSKDSPADYGQRGDSIR